METILHNFSIATAAAALMMTATTGEAMAQAILSPSAAIEIGTDQRRRGLSWTDGAAAVDVSGFLPIGDSLSVSAAATTLRGSARHGGADFGVDLAARYQQDFGGWRLSGGVLGHLFIDRSSLNYVELEGRASYLIGPAQIGLTAAYAPSQNAIGGDNLYLATDASVAVPGMPLSINGGVGHSSGDVDDPIRARRLRPGGSYWDYRIGMEYVAGDYITGLRYSRTSGADANGPSPFLDRHAGARLVGYVRLEL